MQDTLPCREDCMTHKCKAFDLLCAEGEVAGPIDREVIAQAEADLDVEFPAEYRDILLQYGAIIAPGMEVFGLIPKGVNNDPPLWQNVVSVTKELRGWGQVGTEKKNLIPISDDGTGVYIYLDTLASPHTKICAIGPGVEKVFEIDLFSFLIDFAKGKFAF